MAESDDHAELKRLTTERILRNFSLMREYMRMDEAALRTAGHKTTGDALQFAMQSTLRDIKKLDADFLRKWPD